MKHIIQDSLMYFMRLHRHRGFLKYIICVDYMDCVGHGESSLMSMKDHTEALSLSLQSKPKPKAKLYTIYTLYALHTFHTLGYLNLILGSTIA